MKNILKLGHRGAAGYEPENTMLSFHKALELGADGFELDVRKTKDEVLVVIHDDTVDRTSNGKGLVSGLSFSELRELNFGKGERIPTLENVFDIFGGKCLINVELKEGGLGGDVLKLISQYEIFDKVFISAFDAQENKKSKNPTTWQELLGLKRINQRLNVSLLAKAAYTAEKSLEVAKKEDIFSINLPISIFFKRPLLFLNWRPSDLIRRIQESSGSLIVVYDVDYKKHAVALKRGNIDGIISDFPDLLTSL